MMMLPHELARAGDGVFGNFHLPEFKEQSFPLC